MHGFMFPTLISQHQIQHCKQNTGSHNFSCHGRTSRQRYCNFTDCDPLVPVHTSDHNPASTSSVCLLAATPESSNRLQVFCVVSFLNRDLSLPFRAQVRQVAGLLIVLSENVLHEIVDTSYWIGNFPLPQRVQCFLNVPNLCRVLLSHHTVPIDPLFCNFAVSTPLYRGTLSASGNRLVWWSKYPRFFVLIV